MPQRGDVVYIWRTRSRREPVWAIVTAASSTGFDALLLDGSKRSLPIDASHDDWYSTNGEINTIPYWRDVPDGVITAQAVFKLTDGKEI